MSVTSSVYDFVQEHGRTYHRYKQGSKRPLPRFVIFVHFTHVVADA